MRSACTCLCAMFFVAACGSSKHHGEDAAALDAPQVADTGTADAPALDTGLLDTGLSDAGVDAPVDGPMDACPGTGGPSSVRVDAVYDGGLTVRFCIDSTEVTIGQYAEFLAHASVDDSTNSPHCRWKESYNPGSSGDPNLPVALVDWCDAYAFCAWAGKHLCGDVDGSTVSNPDDWAHVAPTYVCTNGARQSYPYGTEYDESACVTDRHDAGVGPLPVASLPTCEGAVPGVYDLVGNVWEYIDICDEDTTDGGSPSVACGFAGAAYDANGPSYGCGSYSAYPRSGTSAAVGFRCCSP